MLFLPFLLIRLSLSRLRDADTKWTVFNTSSYLGSVEVVTLYSHHRILCIRLSCISLHICRDFHCKGNRFSPFRLQLYFTYVCVCVYLCANAMHKAQYTVKNDSMSSVCELEYADRTFQSNEIVLEKIKLRGAIIQGFSCPKNQIVWRMMGRRCLPE